MESGHEGGGVQPVRDGSPADSPFLPVTRRDRLLCAFFLAVIVVAVYHAACGVPALVEAVVSGAALESAELVDEGGADAAGGDVAVVMDPRDRQSRGPGEVRPTVEVVTGNDGREYYDISGLLGGLDVSKSGQNFELSRVLHQVSGVDESVNTGVVKRVLASVATVYGRTVCIESCNSGQRAGIYSRGERLELHGGDKEPKYFGSGQVGIRPKSSGKPSFESMELENRNHGVGGVLSAAPYRLGSATHVRAIGPLADLGGDVARKYFVRFMYSNVGKKVLPVVFAPIISWSIQSAGMTVADEMLAAEIETTSMAVVESAGTRIATAAPELISEAAEGQLTSVIAYNYGARAIANAAEGVTMTADEMAVAVADDVIAFQAGESCPAATSLWTQTIENLMQGTLATDVVPFWANACLQLLDWAGITPTLYADAPLGRSLSDGSGGDLADIADSAKSLFAGYEEFTHYGTTDVEVPNPNHVSQYGADNPKGAEKLTVVTYFPSGEVMHVDRFWAPEGNICINNPGYVNDGRRVFYFTATAGDIYECESGGTGEVYISLGYHRQAVFGQGSNGTYSHLYVTSGVEFDGQLVANGVLGDVEAKVKSVFEDGNVLVGNDAQFDGDGNLVDPGTADVSKVIDNEGGYGSWADALSAGDVVAVKPSDPEKGVTAKDPVTRPAERDPVSGEPVSKPSGEVGEVVRGDDVTPSRVSAKLDNSLNDLGLQVSGKFPFSVPFNVSRSVEMLVAEPEAPHFTWVFALPTGDVRYEVDLSPYSPVAHVLRVMLDVLMVFVVISLLGKVAQVWGFFDKAAD